jgi:ribulose-phosphate 3-epimerase
VPIRRVVPAILTDSEVDLERIVRKTEQFTSWAQFDIMDGIFVPPESIRADHIAALRPDMDYDAHLMVVHPETYIEGFRLAGATRITFHFEACADPIDWVRFIKHQGLEAGLALNPDTPVSVIEPGLADQVDIILLLSVNPGYYGSPFIPGVMDKVPVLRRLFPSIRLGMDGGIKKDNINKIARLGVDEICIGSAIFGQEDPAAAYQKLLALAEEGWLQYCETQ